MENETDIMHHFFKKNSRLSYWLDFLGCFPTFARVCKGRSLKAEAEYRTCTFMTCKWVVCSECEWAFHTSWALLKIWIWDKRIMLDASKDITLWDKHNLSNKWQVKSWYEGQIRLR
jgi:hypothetical protein